MSSYRIIDEPKPRLYKNFIVNPVIILFASVMAPLFIQLSMLAKFSLPFVWLIANGFILGSPTLKREVVYAVLAFFGMFAALMIFGSLVKSGVIADKNNAWPYLDLALHAVFFGALYLIVFVQSVPFKIYEYVKGAGVHE